jgi:hypothetical protein
MQERQGSIEVSRPVDLVLIVCNTSFARKLTRRLEDLTHDSSALKPHLLPQLKTLSNLVPEIVDFGISVRLPFSTLREVSLHESCVLVGATNHASPQ